MNHKRFTWIFISAAVCMGVFLLSSPSVSGAQGNQKQLPAAPMDAVGTAFTYQGRLTDGGLPANGTYNLRFYLWAEEAKTTLLGTYPGAGAIAIEILDGYFTTTIDFGVGIFNGEERWLEIEVNGELLSPLQSLTPTPYAIYAQSAPWNGLANVPTGFADGVDNDTTYSPGYGLNLASGAFSVDISEVQSRVIGSCADGWSIRTIYADGTVYCEIDDDTTYTSGYGLYLASGQFSVNPGEVQSRVIGACADGWAIRTIYGDGTVYCEMVDDPTSVWSLSGNAGTSPGTNYLGTSDNQALVIQVDDTQAFRFEPTSDTPNIIGGASTNFANAGVVGATIGGGGSDSFYNQVSDHFGTIGGGSFNIAGNNAGSTDDAEYGTVGGGLENWATAEYSTIAGGYMNHVNGYNATLGGGSNNNISGSYSTVGGGFNNDTANSYATIGGGWNNFASGSYATVGGGETNTASGTDATIGGGKENTASGTQSTVAGGADNTAGYRATVGGGLSNSADSYGTVPGGYLNNATGYSFAAGRRAKADHEGSFVFADSNDFDFATLVEDSFKVRATGGVRFVVGIDSSGNSTWNCVLTYGNNWSCTSDRNMKENFKPVEGREVLELLSQVPIQRWNAKGGDPEVDHMGPMAQDFYEAFSLGEDDHHIGTMDTNGVALAAIQGLYEISQEQAEQIEELQAENTALRKQVGRGLHGSSSQPFSILVSILSVLVVLLMVGFMWVLFRLRDLGHKAVIHGE